MKLRLIKTTSSIFIAATSSFFGVAEQASAAPKNIQWRTTLCLIGDGDGQVINHMDCQAGFSYGGKLFAVKLFPTDGRPPAYYQVGSNGAFENGADECLMVKFHEVHGGVFESYCTVKTPWELGIKGAPRTFSQSSNTSSSGPSCPMVWSDRYRAYEDCKTRLQRIYRGNVPFRVERDTCGGPPLEVYKPCRQ